MEEHDGTPSRARSRPRSKVFLRLDLENAYARLGVSPLAPPEEIASRIAELRGKAIRRVKAKAQRTSGDEDEAEVHRLDRIADEIGDPKKRCVYDEQHPQNILLTVQPSLAEQAWLRHRKAGLISEWLCRELEESAFVPSPRCLRLWAPTGIADDLLNVLSRFAGGESAQATAAKEGLRSIEESAIPVSLNDLARLIQES